jgi:pyruvate dehydrogenase E1 component alpha subunit
MHIAAPELGMLGANGIVGAGLPIATGAAFSAKLQKNNRVALAFFGDAGSNQGTFHEAINIGSAFNLPVIYICENNTYGVGTHISKTAKVTDIAQRAHGYGIPGYTIDGNDPDIVYETVKKAADAARSGNGPSLIECKTYRHLTHFTGEPDTYRPKEEVESWLNKDPLIAYPKRLIEEGVITEEEYRDMKKQTELTIEEAVKFARESPKPALESALADVYSD